LLAESFGEARDFAAAFGGEDYGSGSRRREERKIHRIVRTMGLEWRRGVGVGGAGSRGRGDGAWFTVCSSRFAVAEWGGGLVVAGVFEAWGARFGVGQWRGGRWGSVGGGGPVVEVVEVVDGVVREAFVVEEVAGVVPAAGVTEVEGLATEVLGDLGEVVFGVHGWIELGVGSGE